MKTAGIVMIILGLAGVTLASYVHYVPFLRHVGILDLRLLGGILIGLGAVTYALVRGI